MRRYRGPVGGKLPELNRRAHGSGQLVQQCDAAAVRVLGSGNQLQMIQIPVVVGCTPLWTPHKTVSAGLAGDFLAQKAPAERSLFRGRFSKNVSEPMSFSLIRLRPTP